MCLISLCDLLWYLFFNNRTHFFLIYLLFDIVFILLDMLHILFLNWIEKLALSKIVWKMPYLKQDSKTICMLCGKFQDRLLLNQTRRNCFKSALEIL